MRHALTTSPTALANVTAGTRYSIQNRSPHTVYLQIATAAPTDAADAFALPPSGPLSTGVVRAATGQSIFVWIAGTADASGAVIYDEAA